MKLIYVTGAGTSVFDAQVLGLISWYQSKKYFKKITLMVGIKSKNEKQFIIKKLTKFPTINLIVFRSFPEYPIINFLNVLTIALKLRKNTDQESFIHIRTEILGMDVLAALRLFKLPFKGTLVDIRGAVKEEIELYYKSNFLLQKLKLKLVELSFERIKDSTYISVVSESLKNYINRKLPKSSIQVIPCLSTPNFVYDIESRLRLRKFMGIDDNEILFVFASGGSSVWQMNEQIINILIDNGYKVLNLSKNQIKKKNVINKFVNHSEVNQYFSASDIAIIWRENNIVNNVASPVKFSEYLNVGLPIICNDSVDLINYIVKKESVGICIKSLDKIDNNVIKQLQQLNRAATQKVGKKYFDVSVIASKYLKLYNDIN